MLAHLLSLGWIAPIKPGLQETLESLLYCVTSLLHHLLEILLLFDFSDELYVFCCKEGLIWSSKLKLKSHRSISIATKVLDIESGRVNTVLVL